MARIGVLAGLSLASILGVGSTASAKPQPLPPDVKFVEGCAPGEGCHVKIPRHADGSIYLSTGPSGLEPSDLDAAYDIDPSLGSGLTVAVVDAFGDSTIEADIAAFRSQFGLPACTIASGCLTVMNQDGATSPLPADPGGQDASWQIETALDTEMVSAVCPQCKIVLIQTATPGEGLYIGQKEAAKLNLAAISDSWSAAEDGSENDYEEIFDNPGTTSFVATGDDGYNVMPQYPSTSAFAIAVGGTTLSRDATALPRGFTEVVWNNNIGAGGSSCSGGIPKPSYEPLPTVCGMRAAADVSAVADGDGGLAIFSHCSGCGGGAWMPVDGTSAATPITAALFAAAGHGAADPAFIYAHPEAFIDITSGTNGSCGTPLCNAGSGWDGPTGMGTPDQGMIAAIGNVAGAGPDVTVTFPTAGSTVDEGFSVAATAGSDAFYMDVAVDGTKVGASRFTVTVPAPPTATVTTPLTITAGAHTVTVTAYDIDHNSKITTLDVTVGSSGGGGGGCAAGGSGAGGLAAIGAALAAVIARRRRG